MLYFEVEHSQKENEKRHPTKESRTYRILFFKIVTGVWKMEMVGMIGLLLSMCAEKLN